MTLNEFLDRLQALINEASELPAHEIAMALEDQFIAKQGEIMRQELRGRGNEESKP